MNSIVFRKVGSKSELDELLRSSDRNTLLLKGEETSTSQYGVIELEELIIGFSYQNNGIKPQIESIDNSEKILFGMDSKLQFVSVLSRLVTWEKKLDGIFINYRFIPERDIILVNYEIGILALRRDDTLLWDVPLPDVIEDYKLIEDSLSVKTMEMSEYRIVLETGKVYNS